MGGLEWGGASYAWPPVHLANGGWRKFHRVVFVSSWQAAAFISKFGIPWSRCQVILNAVEPSPVSDGRLVPVPDGTPVRLACAPVPHRGLDILHAVFRQICELGAGAERDVFSSPASRWTGKGGTAGVAG
jgi:hypothetical protein